MNCCAKLIVIAVALTTVGGCAKPNMIPNTKVQDTKLNRELLQVVEKYRRAMERRDAATILSLVHPTYRDHAGTPEASDDVDYDGVKTLLKSRFKRVSKVRYQIEYQDVRVEGAEAKIDCYIDATFLYEEPKANPRHHRKADYNRFTLIRDGGKWRFISGL